MKTLYIYPHGDRCITHDGYIQLGIMSHGVERHIELNSDVNWVIVHWLPDPFSNRYKRLSFQKTQACRDA